MSLPSESDIFRAAQSASTKAQPFPRCTVAVLTWSFLPTRRKPGNMGSVRRALVAGSLVAAVALGVGVGYVLFGTGPVGTPTPAPSLHAVVTMPNIVGLGTDNALMVLHRTGLRVSVTVPHWANESPDVVTSQDPAAGTAVSSGSTVQIVLAG
jgi:hypothetical protein